MLKPQGMVVLKTDQIFLRENRIEVGPKNSTNTRPNCVEQTMQTK